MRPNGVVMATPLFDADLRFDAIAKPRQREMLVAKLPVERFVGRILDDVSRSTVNRQLNIIRGCFSRSPRMGTSTDVAAAIRETLPRR